MARILILDDDLAALAVAKRAVRAAGHDAIAVTSAADARAALEDPTAPDVLLAAATADSGEALALAERIDAARTGTAVLLVGEDRGTSIPAIPKPLDGRTVGASLARALASRRLGPSPSPQTAAAPTARRPAAASGESRLRALFRRTGAPLVAASSPEPAARRTPLDLPRLQALARSADYFSVLGLPRHASGSEVRDAAAGLLAEVNAWLLPHKDIAASPELGELEELRQVLLDARDVLADDTLRAAYLKGIEDVAEPASS